MQFLNELLKGINDNLELILVGIGILLGIVEKSRKLPFNPVSKIFNWIKKNLKDDELDKKVDELSKKLEETNRRLVDLENTADIREMNKLRFQILEFDRVLRNCKKSDVISQEQFMTIFDMMSDYEKLVELHHIDNNKFEKAREYIDKRYNELYG